MPFYHINSFFRFLLATSNVRFRCNFFLNFTLQLLGINQQVLLQVFVVTDQGKVRPHGYYQACKVTGRNTTPSEEKDVEGTTVLEVPWEPVDGKMEISVDCIGILKLRNADVEQRIGPLRSKRKSTCVRLAFRVIVPASDGSFNVVQTVSRSITCSKFSMNFFLFS